MSSTRSFRVGVRQLYAHLSSSRKRQLHLLLILMVLNAVAELGTIGSVLPLLTLITDADRIEKHAWLVDALRPLGGSAQADLLMAAAGVFCAFAIASGLLRLQLARTTYGFGYDLAHELTMKIQTRLLFQPYIFHVQRNTSTLISALDKANILVFDVVLPLTQALTAAFIGLVIVMVLIAVDAATALAAATIFVGIYALVSTVASARLAANSRIISKGIDERLKIVQESLGGIRDVIIDGSQASFLDQLDQENAKLGRARANTAVIAMGPRFLIETVGIVAIALVALFVSGRQGGFESALPALGAMALGAQRLLPLVQQAYRGWTTASGHLSVIGDTVSLLALPVDEAQADRSHRSPLPFQTAIAVKNLSFTYPGQSEAAVQAVSFNLPAGSAVALIGATGSGKSTLADLLMGLLDPDEGLVSVDGVPLTKANRGRWQRSIAHVPQSIFLTDSTIAQNIGLSLPESPLMHDRVVEAAKRAHLHDFVTSLPNGYETRVGERGIRLSGGQRQRLGIARAIYKNAPLMILDEATSALDAHTESVVLAELEELRRDGRTIVIIAHRPSTVQHCDLVVQLDHGRLVDFGPAVHRRSDSVRPGAARRPRR